MASSTAFTVLQFAGAAYLLFTGVQMLLARARPLTVDAVGGDATSLSSVFCQGALTNVLNPKVALFFLAFLPQFVHPERGMVWLQFLVLGELLSLIGFCNSAVLSMAIGRFGRQFNRKDRFGPWQRRALGTFFVALGLRLALQQRA